jgi:hypothetical protein
MIVFQTAFIIVLRSVIVEASSCQHEHLCGNTIYKTKTGQSVRYV